MTRSCVFSQEWETRHRTITASVSGHVSRVTPVAAPVLAGRRIGPGQSDWSPIAITITPAMSSHSARRVRPREPRNAATAQTAAPSA